MSKETRWILAVAGWLAGVLLLSLLADPMCADGWRSSSIGRQGACSHHGGVVYKNGWLWIPFSVVYFWFLRGFLTRPDRKQAEDPSSTDRPQLVSTKYDDQKKEARDDKRILWFWVVFFIVFWVIKLNA